MKKTWFIKFLLLSCVILPVFNSSYAQEKSAPPIKSQEVSDSDGVPVLVKHLPDWENAQSRATYILNQTDLQSALGERDILKLINFQGGTEAVTTPYEQGKLLLVEFTTPQASIDADEKIKQKLAESGRNPQIFYRRIGNYNVFVFDTSDESAATELFDQIKYEKNVQWLSEDPFLLKRAERALVKGLSELFVATTLAIVGGLGLSVIAGIIVGIIFFRIREQKRATMETFSDAGGMTRLNLDGFTPQIASDRLLDK